MILCFDRTAMLAGGLKQIALDVKIKRKQLNQIPDFGY